jgi:hypothetical protein
VLIETGDVPPSPLPVKTRNLAVVPFREPRIDSVIAQAGADQPILAGATVLIQGSQLRGDITRVLLDDQEIAPATLTDTQLTFVIPGDIHGGVKGPQVVQKISIGTPPVPHRGFESNVVPFVLRPSITAATAAVKSPGITTVTLTLAPNIGVGQRAVLQLNNTSVTPPTAFTSLPVVSPADSNQVQIDIAGVPTGAYLVRVQIDGAESLLDATLSSPTVAMP